MDILSYCSKNNITWAFFDCFDTLICHTLLEDDLVRKWTIEMSEYVPIDVQPSLMSIRLDVINNFHKEEYFNYNYTEIMNAVYDRLVYTQKCSTLPEKACFIKKALKEELQLIQDFCIVDEKNTELLYELSANHIKIAMVSDFYIGAEWISDILESKHIRHLFDEVFVSCDYKARKSDGDLYQVVLDAINEHGDKCIMIGDNRISDVKRARKYQIHPFYRPYKSNLLSLEKSMEYIYKKNHTQTIEGLHYSYSLSLFFLRLLKRLQENEQRDVFFLAREGEFLKAAFDRYLSINNCNDIRTHYLYVSRKATLMPSLNELYKEKFERVFRQTTVLSVDEFLKLLNFSLEDRKKIYNCLCGVDCNEVHLHFNQHKIFADLCKMPLFLMLYEEKRQRSRAAFLSYLKTFNVDIWGHGLVVVDVGWKGTIQDNIYHALGGEVKIRGFYLGLTGLGGIRANNIKEGLLFSVAPIKSKDYGVWLNREFYERFMRASHGMTLCYQIKNDRGYPVLEEKSTEDDAYNFVQSTQKAIISNLIEIEQIFRRYEADNERRSKLLLILHKRFVLHLRRRDIKFERKVFELNKESFVVNAKADDLKSIWKKILHNIKYTIKHFFSIEFYNGPFRAYNFPIFFVMLWGRCIYWKQKMRGEL